jgi:ABC-type multidrug transport system fused ATPase/permease subunit
MAVFRAVQRASKDWSRRLFRRAVKAPMSEVMYRSTGEQIARIVHDPGMVAVAYRSVFGTAVTKLLNGFAALGMALAINWRLTLIGLVGAPVIGVMIWLIGKRIRAASNRAMQGRGLVVARLREAMQHYLVVKANEAEGVETRRFSRITRDLETDEMAVRRMDAISKPAVEVVSVIGVGMVASIAAYQVLRRDVPAAEFLTVLAMLGASGEMFQRVLGLFNQVQEATPMAKRMVEGFHAVCEEAEDRRLRMPSLPLHRQSIRFEHLNYSYPKAAGRSLEDVSLDVQHGMTVAIVGPNGSGKTTLMRMLSRFLLPGEGRVLVDGVDIAAVNLRSLRKQIAVVTQEIVLFRGTIAENIAYGRPHADHAQIEAAARAARVDEFVARLPGGYDSSLGDEGAGLSGGEKQRICLARAILRDPAILILDEATSQVDSESESKINQILREFRRGRTTFIVAHRLSTVIDADVIVVMNAGRIVDRGTHIQLLEHCVLYRQLVQHQMIGTEIEIGA